MIWVNRSQKIQNDLFIFSAEIVSLSWHHHVMRHMYILQATSALFSWTNHTGSVVWPPSLSREPWASSLGDSHGLRCPLRLPQPWDWVTSPCPRPGERPCSPSTKLTKVSEIPRVNNAPYIIKLLICTSNYDSEQRNTHETEFVWWQIFSFRYSGCFWGMSRCHCVEFVQAWCELI